MTLESELREMMDAHNVTAEIRLVAAGRDSVVIDVRESEFHDAVRWVVKGNTVVRPDADQG